MLFLQAQPVLKVGDVVKFRCVNISYEKEGRIVGLTENSSCLVVPEYFLDNSLFDKSAKITPMKKTPSKYTPKRSGKVTPLTTKRVASVSYPFLEDYEYEDILIDNPELKKNSVSSKKVTLIKKIYEHRAPTPISELITILESPEDYQHQRFVISGYIFGTSQSKLNKLVKKMDTTTKKVYNFNEKVPIDVASNLQYIYHFVLSMRDSSVEATDEFMNVYVLTNEGN